MSRIYDISLPIHEAMIVWPTDPRVSIVRDPTKGKASTISRLEMGSHTGTHVDAPSHFIRGGGSVDQIALDILIGPARIFALDARGPINSEVLERLDLGGVSRVLFKTGNSDLYKTGAFEPDFIYLTADGADMLIGKGVRLIGIDYLSIDEYGNREAPAHHRLLTEKVVILESIDLSGVEPGDYDLICLPLRLAGGDGAPARAVLIKS